MRRLALLAALSCLVALVANPMPVAAASPALKAAQACRKALSSWGRRYIDTRRRLLLGCVDRLLKCELKLEIDGTSANDCRSRAESSCNRNLDLNKTDSRISKFIARADTKTAEGCADLGLTEMLSLAAGGLWYNDIAACNTETDVPSLVSCLRSELELEADGVVGRTVPRAGLLLDNAGLGDLYPNLPRPPIVQVVVSAVALDGGDLNNPGTLMINSGEALEFSGDQTTLPCGGGQNGKLSIFVSGEPDPCNDALALERQIKEPYGPDVSVVLGPFTGDLNYCVRLKDSQCSDEEIGLIDVQ